MKKNSLLMMCLGFCSLFYAQIGVNTENPSVTFEVKGNPTDTTIKDGVLVPRLTGDQLRAKDSVYGTEQNGTLVYVTAATSTISQKTVNITAPGYYFYDAPNSVWKSTNNGGGGTGTALYARRDGALSLINLGISGTNWNKINLTSTDTRTGIPSLLNNGVYTASKTGIYSVDFEVQLESGANLEVLGGKKLGVLKNGTTVFEEKVFDAVRVSILGTTLAAVPVTSSTLSTMIQLNAGETLTFAVETGGVDLGILTNGKVTLSVYKVSD